jgi:N,N'-diacetylchitobiose transport system permease protein
MADLSLERPAAATQEKKTQQKSSGKGVAAHGRATPWLLLTPSALAILLVTIAPIGYLIWVSVTNYNQRGLFTGAFEYVGLEQYTTTLGSSEFWMSLLRTGAMTGAMVGLSVVLGVGFAQLLARLGAPMRVALSVVLVLVWAMPTVATSLVWTWLFQPGYGVVNWILTQLRVFGDLTDTDWASSPSLAFTSIVILVVWQAVPFIALTLYAALSQMPGEWAEAARVDGASEWRLWWSVTLPYLRPTLLLVSILSLIWDFNVFNQIWLVSQGGPDDATSTLGVYAYKTAFVGFEVGHGAAISVLTTVLLAGLSAVYVRRLIRSGEEL